MSYASKFAIGGALLLALAACSDPKTAKTDAPAKPAGETAAAPASAAKPPADLPAGEYTLDKTHADLSFKVNHLGFSWYTARFSDFDAKLTLDPKAPEAAHIEASIKTGSLLLPAPPKGFTEELLGPQWLDAAKYPAITFRSTKVSKTGDDTADVTGDLTLHGVTKPVTLKARFNGAYTGYPPMDPNARIGFSLTGSFKRSDFGVSYGVPQPGSTMGVGDEVQVAIEAELLKPNPPAANAPPAPGQP
ncbi:polyisoprenoid-binding protein [Caulobacter flavus]|uniref:Polyisoprenoid-binding protein n=1 Tax=Caulobacter flavus TaxID=1679497 RepID=A0A2N5CMB8_9CAUL|nr:YceI family protein [Caulobacter flavus]AYV49387.1 polyisoprenoid-binding protein [Caulobacter flavus]PLR07113.1 polyisoprenoid-binding protein [Caulobacter flavus]